MGTDESTVVALVNEILHFAIRGRASDLHFEPYEDQFRVRYRIDGSLAEMEPLRRVLAVPVVSRLKVLADLNISEQRMPQDGRIQMTVDGRTVDLRVSTLPIQSGESVVIRILDKSNVHLNLDVLGMSESVLKRMRSAVGQPNGILLVTGPTGSGKTTTLYSALKEVNDSKTKILTAEDPVEYEVEGLIQTSINAEIGVGFAETLRAFLRQDPDKILIGEIRDLETARIAVQASLTGHLVLSTLHTNDAAGVVTRLIDMGLERYLLASTLKLVLAQRLLRKVCLGCREWETIDEVERRMLGLERYGMELKKAARGKGCSECGDGGYAGRLALFELLEISEGIRKLILKGASRTEMKKAAIKEGMLPLRECGLKGLADGKTTVKEVLTHT